MWTAYDQTGTRTGILFFHPGAEGMIMPFSVAVSKLPNSWRLPKRAEARIALLLSIAVGIAFCAFTT
ncbi:MAG: hypothetical protein LJE67_04990 [Salaquimonas sp.]|jgi:hypothetical protein|nr:hypothetical protein [Salaquimonas sp.]